VSDDSVTLMIEVTTDQFTLAMKALSAHAETLINPALRFRSGMGAFRRTVAATHVELASLMAALDALRRRSAMHTAYRAKTRRRNRR